MELWRAKGPNRPKLRRCLGGKEARVALQRKPPVGAGVPSLRRVYSAGRHLPASCGVALV